MSEKQAIEVGQVWEHNSGSQQLEVVEVSPAWVKISDENQEISSLRKSHLWEYWKLIGINTPPLELPDAEPDNTSTHAAMQAAVSAFNAVTGKHLDESDGWLLNLLYDMSASRIGTTNENDTWSLYQESREVD